MKGKTAGKIIALFAVAGMLAGCGGKTGTTPDDYATNDGYITDGNRREQYRRCTVGYHIGHGRDFERKYKSRRALYFRSG